VIEKRSDCRRKSTHDRKIAKFCCSKDLIVNACSGIFEHRLTTLLILKWAIPVRWKSTGLETRVPSKIGSVLVFECWRILGCQKDNFTFIDPLEMFCSNCDFFNTLRIFTSDKMWGQVYFVLRYKQLRCWGFIRFGNARLDRKWAVFCGTLLRPLVATLLDQKHSYTLKINSRNLISNFIETPPLYVSWKKKCFIFFNPH